MAWKPKRQPADVGKLLGYRSGLEDLVAEQLALAGIDAEYEELTIPFMQPVKPRRYTPDFVLPNGIVIETKGRFVTADRQKHLLVQEQYPGLDIRFVFSNPQQRISKQSQTTYAMWCESKRFQYAKRTIPIAWLQELPNETSLSIINTLSRR